jgi:hypothetical protein
MAAVICESLGSLCRGCSEIICLPCKACGVGCECLWELVGSAFFPYMFVTFALNIPPFALGLKSIMDFGTCKGEATWMIVNGACCFIHMIASLYIVHRVQEEEKSNFPQTQPTTTTTTTVISASVYDSESKKETTTVISTPDTANLEYGTYQKMYNDDFSPSNSWGRIHHIMCYDKGVALYIIVVIAWIFYLTVGIAKFLTQEGGCGEVSNRMLVSVFSGWIYMSIVGCAFLCSMCCMKM